MKKIYTKILSILAISTATVAYGQTVTSATYTTGDLESDRSFTALPGTSTCFGTLSVSVPAGETVYQVDVSYDMTAANGAWMSEQRSWLYCATNTTGEANLAAGTGGASGGTESYSRTVTIANGITGGTVDFELHLGRTYGGSACDPAWNTVPSGTWTIDVYSATCVPPNGFTLGPLDNDSAFVSWTTGGSETMWNIEYGPSGFTQGTGTTQTVNTVLGDTISGLTQLTDYDVYIQSDCGGGDESAWVGPLSFTTLANCPDVSGLFLAGANADSAFISWTSNGPESMWNIEYGIVGFTQGSGTVVPSTSTTDTITGLGNTVYDFYVQSDCGGTDQGIWIGPLTVVMPIVNDTVCGAIEIPVDGSTGLYSNQGATATGPAGSQNIWFKFVAPASGTVALSACDGVSNIDSEMYVYEDISTVDCSNTAAFVQMDYADGNPFGCGSSPSWGDAGMELCGLNPGATYYFSVGPWGGSGTYIFPISAWDLEVDAGTGTEITLCETDTLDLWTQLSGQDHNMGNWDYPNNPNGIADDSLFVAANSTASGDEVYYIIANTCMEDTATVTVNVVGPANSGTAIDPFDACNTNVFLFDGLTGTVDMGGTWTDDTGTGLLLGDIFAAHAVPVGGYNFTYTASNGVCADQSTTVTVNIMDCTDIPESDINFSIYPNPNNGEFFIENNGNTGLVTVEVIDIQGKVVYNNRLNISNGDRESISLENAESGMYMIRIISNDNVVNHPMIVK